LDGPVPGGREIAAAELQVAGLVEETALDVVHDRRLDAAAHGAAAHQKAVDVDDAAVAPQEDGADRPLVAEAVAGAHPPELADGRGDEALDLGRRVARGREVELARAGEELMDARQVVPFGAGDREFGA